MAERRHLRLLLGADYDRTRALRDGRIDDPDIRTSIDLIDSPHDVFSRLAFTDEYDGGEMSLSFYATTLSRLKESSKYVGLPIFLSRMFRHGNILVREGAGIVKPEHLNGRTIGVPEYGLTMGVWVRGLLTEEYGFNPRTARWRTGRTPAALTDDLVRYPDGVDIVRGDDQAGQLMALGAGRLDAYIGPVPPPAQLPAGVHRLFADYDVQERDYFRRTGVFPIMHVLVLRRSVIEADPRIAEHVIRVFSLAKDLAIEQLKSSAVLRVSLPWLLSAVEEQERLCGGNLWPYGLEENRSSLETFVRYANEQGLVWSELKVAEMFVG